MLIPSITLKTEKKYFRLSGILEINARSGSWRLTISRISGTNSCTIKYNAKNTVNFTMTARNKNPRTPYKTEVMMPNINHLYAERIILNAAIE